MTEQPNAEQSNDAEVARVVEEMHDRFEFLKRLDILNGHACAGCGGVHGEMLPIGSTPDGQLFMHPRCRRASQAASTASGRD